MHISKHFVLTILFLFVIAFGFYFFVKPEMFFDTVSSQYLSQVDSFLLKEMKTTLGVEKHLEDKIRIHCDEKRVISGEEKIAFSCQNENPTHKIVIGLYSKSLSYEDVISSLGNEQIFWKKFPDQSSLGGSISCKKRIDFPYFKDALYGVDCVSLINEKNDNEKDNKKFSSVMFFDNKDVNDKNFFVAVLNTSNTSSYEETEKELLSIIKNKRENKNSFSFKELFASYENFSGKDSFTLDISSDFSFEKNKHSVSGTRNIITKESGTGIDATVCDVVDNENCYPIYCESKTAVWAYSVNKCVEPSIQNISNENSCEGDTPIWDGSKCRGLSGNIILADECKIGVGKNSCDLKIKWFTEKTNGNVELRLPTDESVFVIGSGSRGEISYTLKYKNTPYIISLYDLSGKLNEIKVNTGCLEGGFDITTNQCVDPKISSVIISGEYYSNPGTMSVSCSNADKFFVKNTDTNEIISSSTETTNGNVSLYKTGNYQVVCLKGSYEGVPVVKYYNSPPPPKGELSLFISPRTLIKNQKTLISWNIHFPLASCSLTASAVCKNGNDCTPSQVEFENQINERLQNELTDKDAFDEERPIQKAVKEIAKSYDDKDFVARGQKTFEISETTDFILSCGDLVEKRRVYVRSVSQTTKTE